MIVLTVCSVHGWFLLHYTFDQGQSFMLKHKRHPGVYNTRLYSPRILVVQKQLNIGCLPLRLVLLIVLRSVKFTLEYTSQRSPHSKCNICTNLCFPKIMTPLQTFLAAAVMR